MLIDSDFGIAEGRSWWAFQWRCDGVGLVGYCLWLRRFRTQGVRGSATTARATARLRAPIPHAHAAAVPVLGLKVRWQSKSYEKNFPGQNNGQSTQFTSNELPPRRGTQVLCTLMCVSSQKPVLRVKEIRGTHAFGQK